MHLCVSECVSVVYTSVCVCVASSLSILPLCEFILSVTLAVFVYVLGHFAACGYVGGCVYTHVHLYSEILLVCLAVEEIGHCFS